MVSRFRECFSWGHQRIGHDWQHGRPWAYRDILLWDFMDTFFNLTLKEIHFLNWAAEFCHNVKFIFKGDDDVFVNIENIVDFLERHKPSEDLFVGDIINNAHPIHTQKIKYYIPETMHDLSIYPAYAEGRGFLMSRCAMRKLSRACGEVELFPIDGVFLGMCLQSASNPFCTKDSINTFGIVFCGPAPTDI
ncbi:UNVERIFIED_CONTAM: hypothetical protein H355_003767 [Colinus virginianus]|nr:hypothetical protein H355_003767 [Colinus virginianus]